MRLRLRGIGSGFKEGHLQQEYNERLHFNVSCETEDILHKSVYKITEHVNQVRSEIAAAGGIM